MIDDEGKAEIVEQSAGMLLYDYFKHLTSLSLFSRGGILALAEKARGTESYGMLISVMATVGVSAICSFSGASEIVTSRYRKHPPRYVNFYRVAAPVLLSVGVGAFIYMFAKTMAAS
jgi:hypothetical protein